VGISFDPVEANRAFAERQALPFRLLSDRDRSVGDRYGVRRDPGDRYPELPRRITYLIDPEGRVARAYSVSDVTTHPAQVLEDLRALRGQGKEG
jgi:peroxiredoxin Q/BCP